MHSYNDPLIISQFPHFCHADICPVLQTPHEINMQGIKDDREASYVKRTLLMWSRLSQVRPHYIAQSINYLIPNYKVGLTSTDGCSYACPSSKNAHRKIPQGIRFLFNMHHKGNPKHPLLSRAASVASDL